MIDDPLSAPSKGAANVSIVGRLEERGRGNVLSAKRKLRDKNITEMNFLVGRRKGRNYSRDATLIIIKNSNKKIQI